MSCASSRETYSYSILALVVAEKGGGGGEGGGNKSFARHARRHGFKVWLARPLYASRISITKLTPGVCVRIIAAICTLVRRGARKTEDVKARERTLSGMALRGRECKRAMYIYTYTFVASNPSNGELGARARALAFASEIRQTPRVKV